MKMNRSNFGELLTPIHKKIFFQDWSKLGKQYTQIYWVFDMNKKEETFPHLGDFAMWDSNTEGNTINETEINQGDTAMLVAERYDDGYSVTWELVRDDQYDIFSGMGKNGSASGMAYGLETRIETLAAGVINDGFANTGYDGTSLFSDSHTLYDAPGSSGENLLTGALNPANLKLGMTKMRNTVNNAGLKIMVRAKQLITGPDLEFTALEITKSTNQAFEQSNTENVIQGIKPIVMDYIDGNTWVLRDNNPRFKNLAFGWRDKPFFDTEKLPKTLDYFYYSAARFSLGAVSWRGLAASPGN